MAVTTILCATSLWSARALAQETTGSLEGRLLDRKGKPIGYVYVIVTGPSVQGTRGAVTTLDGRFLALALPVGECAVKFAHVSYVEQTFAPIRIRLGQRTSLGDVVLEDRVHEVKGVTVTGEVHPLIDSKSTEMGGTLGANDYETLPIERDYRSMVTILPQASISYFGDETNFAGSTGLENRYFIDGVDVTDPVQGATGAGLSYQLLDDVEVRAGGYEAEYHSSLGGTINATTRSGGNERTFRVFGFFTNDGLAESPLTGTGEGAKGTFRDYDAGLSMGGPIQKDRLWYYVAYNPTVQGQDTEVPGWGTYDDRTTTHSFAAKLTWRAGERNSLVFTALGDPNERHAVNGEWVMDGEPATLVNVDPALTNIRSGGVNFVYDGRHLVGDNFLLRTSLSRATRTNENVPETGTTDVLFADHFSRSISGGPVSRVENHSAVTSVAVTGTWIRKSHEFKAGMEYRDTRWYLDQEEASLDFYADSTYGYWRSGAQGRVGTRVPSAFLQDSWRLAERLQINAGLRWDGQYIISSEGNVAQSILDQWQPRAGFTYQPGRPGSQKIFGSFGRFYQDLATWPLFLYYNEGSYWTWQSYDHDPRIDPSGGSGWELGGQVQPEIDMKGQYNDEYTLGYERVVGAQTTVGVRGVYRSLRQGLEDGEIAPGTNEFEFGNPGRGRLSSYPRAKREYKAMEITLRQEAWKQLTILASYVLSENSGNYPGLFNSDYGYAFPNANGSFDIIEGAEYWDGLLPNDRTHVFKLSGSYRVGMGMTVGTTAFWETGTPMTDFAPSASGYVQDMFIGQRGTAGRTPSVWDLNLRLMYEPPFLTSVRLRPKFVVDFLHVGNPRGPVAYDMKRYLEVDAEGNPFNPNPNYRNATSWQPPMYVRMGVDVQF